MTIVKICGLTHPDDVRTAVEAGADRLGFVVEYPIDVPWELTARRARELMDVAEGTVGVPVVGGDADHILRIVERTGATMVQLHLDEPPEVVARVAAAGVHVIKALRAEAGYPVGSPDVWIATARYFVEAGAGEILLDSSSGERPAGTGRRFDWEVARQVVEALDVPVVLAGGLDPDNITAALTTVRPAGVDVISGVSAAGVRKDPARMRAFVQRVRAALPGR